MSTSFERLKQLAPPTRRTANTDVSSSLRTDSPTHRVMWPESFPDLLAAYGCGWFDGFLCILSPVARNPLLNLFDVLENRTQSLAGCQALGLPVPFPIFPKPDGLIPWGYSNNGDTLYWRTLSPEECHTVVQSPDLEWIEFNLPPIDFLCDLLDAKITIPFFPDDFPCSEHFFRPELDA